MVDLPENLKIKETVMVTDSIIGLIYNAFMYLFGAHEPLRFNISATVYNFIHDFVAFIFFILPMNGLQVIFGLIVAVIMFRIVVSVIKTIWDLIPIL